jgi:hypothetical protein
MLRRKAYYGHVYDVVLSRVGDGSGKLGFGLCVHMIDFKVHLN